MLDKRQYTHMNENTIKETDIVLNDEKIPMIV